MSVVNVLAVIVAVPFALSGAMKIAALAPARKLAEEVHYSVSAYRMIGLLELAAATALIVAIFALHPLGVLAASGLIMLMGAGLGTHLRNGDPVSRAVPAISLGLLSTAYVVAASWPA